MHADVDERATAGAFLRCKPATDPLRDSARPHPRRLRVVDLPQPSRRDQLLRRAHPGRESKLSPEKINQAALPGLLVQDLHFRRVQSRRLFAENMFPGFKRCPGSGEMEKVRQTDDDRVDLRILQQFVIIAETFSAARRFVWKTARLSESRSAHA